MHSNLPPGVSEGMIPGNRPEDVENDAFWDEFGKKCDDDEYVHIPEEHQDEEWFIYAIQIARDMGWDRGFSEGLAEAEIRRAEEMNPDG